MGWSPYKLSPFLWYRADYDDINYGVYPLVSQWDPKVGSYPLTQAAAAQQPTFLPSYQNGKDAIQFLFDGVVDFGDRFKTADFAAPLSQPNTILAVLVGPSATGTNKCVFDSYHYGQTMGREITTNKWFMKSATQKIISGSPTTAWTTLDVMKVEFNDNPTGTSLSRVYKRATQLGTAGAGVAPGDATMVALCLGGSNWSGITGPADIIVCEFIILNRLITDAEYTSYINYAVSRWAL